MVSFYVQYCYNYKPKFHLLRHVRTRHDTTSTTCCASCDVSYVLRRACSNMADDEETCFIIIYHFSSQIKLIRLLKKNTAIITLQTNQVAYRACRARRDQLVTLIAIVVSDMSRLLRSSYDFFLYQNTWASQRVVSRDVS